MESRRFFATRTSGLRLDAVASVAGHRARRGGTLPAAAGDVTFAVDLGRDDSWLGRPLAPQVLRPGGDVPEVVAVRPFEFGGLVSVTVPLDAADGDWLVPRVSDPAQPNAAPGPPGHPGHELGLAYASPWWLDPA